MRAKDRKKMLAIGMLSVYMLSVFALVIPDDGGLDAETGPDYTYVLTFSSSSMTVTKNGVEATPIKTSTTESWGFDSDGYGPFNSFYAAFSTSTGKMVAHLDPYDLSKSIDQSDTTNYKGSTSYNIMWVLPTVYWKATNTTLTLTNNPTGDGWCCLGHTIDGKVYKYLALGVYEAYCDSSKMYSISDKVPAASKTRAQFRALAQADTVDGGYAMQWNFFQWTLYKMCAYTVMGSLDSQSDWAYGIAKGSKTNTGTNSNNSPYYRIASNPTSANGVSKVFLENTWGNVGEFVDNVIFSSQKIYAGYSHTATDTTSNLNVISGSYTLSSTGNTSSVYTANEVWDMPTSSGGTNIGTHGDYVCSNTGSRVLWVGGSYTAASNAGVAYTYAYNNASYSNTNIGSRLAYVFDSDPLSGYTMNYDANGGILAVTEEKVKTGQSITLPTPTRSGYRFDGWYNGNTPVSSPYTPTANVTLTAHWTQYAVTVNNSILQSVYSATLNTTLTNMTNVVTSGSAVVLPDLGYQKVTYQGQDYLYLHTGWSYTNSNTPTLSKTQSIPNADTIGKTVYSTWVPVITISNPNNIGTIQMPTTSTGTSNGLTYLKSDQTVWPTFSDTSTGYRHVGFILSNDNSTVTAGTAIGQLTRSITAISVWVEPEVIITFKSSSDEHVIATISVPKGSIGVVFEPVLEDIFAFGGWFYDKACTQRYDSTVALTENITLWASAIDKLVFTSDPVSNGTITPYNVDMGTFLFDATMSESAYKVLWDFGDGSTSEKRLTYHTYEVPGKYNVTLTTTNYSGQTDVRTYSVSTIEEENNEYAKYIVAGVIVLLAGLFIGRRFL